MIARELRCHANALAFGLLFLAAPLSAALVQTGDVSPNVNTWTSNTTGYIGDTSDGSVTVDAGSLLASRNGYLGDDPGVTGTVTITGAGSKWTNSRELRVGRYGNGTLTIGAGGQVSSGASYLGRELGSTGLVTVTGAGSQWTNSDELFVGDAGNGTLTVLDEGEVTAGTLFASPSDLHGNGTITTAGAVLDADLVFDAAHGTSQSLAFGSEGSLNVTISGSQAAARGDLGAGYKQHGSLTISEGVNVSSRNGYLGYSTGSTGTATVNGPNSKWTISRWLVVGESGNGAFTIEAGGLVSNTSGYLGRLRGSTGTATVTGAGSTWTNSAGLVVGGRGNGSLTVSDGGEVIAGTLFASLSDLHGDGTITATTGAVLDANLVFDAAHGTSQSLAFGSGGTLSVTVSGSQDAVQGYLGAGYRQSGSLTISEGVTIYSRSGYLGDQSNSTGTATVTGAGSKWANAEWFYVGLEGSGALTIKAGGQVSNGRHSYIGHYVGSTGTATVTGVGSLWTTVGELYVGDNGNGSLTVAAGGQVSNGSGFVGSIHGTTGTATISGVGSKWTNRGSLSVSGAGNSTLTIDDGGLVSVGGILRIDYRSPSDSFINMTTGGMLALKGNVDDSLSQFLNLVQGTDAIRYWDASLADWAPLTSAIYGTDYTLEYLTQGDLAGYTLLTVGTAIPEPATWLLAISLAVACTVRRCPKKMIY